VRPGGLITAPSTGKAILTEDKMASGKRNFPRFFPSFQTFPFSPFLSSPPHLFLAILAEDKMALG